MSPWGPTDTLKLPSISRLLKAATLKEIRDNMRAPPE